MRYRGDHSPPLHSKRRRGSLAQLGELLQNLGSSKDRERSGGGLRYRGSEPGHQQGQREVRRRPQVQGSEPSHQ